MAFTKLNLNKNGENNPEQCGMVCQNKRRETIKHCTYLNVHHHQTPQNEFAENISNSNMNNSQPKFEKVFSRETLRSTNANPHF